MISRQAKQINYVLRKMNFKQRTTKDILKPKRYVHFEKPPKSIGKKYKLTKDVIEDVTCFTLESHQPATHHLFYYHGGAYSIDASRSHWKLIDYILEHTNTKVSFINYPLYPESTCLNTIKISLDIYRQLVDESCDIILAGDSAGAGLALALAQHMSSKINLKQASKLLLFSPWLDITFRDTISEELMDHDLILSKETLIQAGIHYAGDLNPENPLCSPLYGDCKNIGKIALFTGTHDILNTQASTFNTSLTHQGITIDYHEYKEMQHVWMILPTPEAIDALQKACTFINLS